jgi:tRNA (mo5U34)-methyltransferase
LTSRLIDSVAVAARFEAVGLARWAEVAAEQIDTVLFERPHGDWSRWREAIESFPDLGPGQVEVNDGAVWLRPETSLDEMVRKGLRDGLMPLHPWRKGPFRIDDLVIDTEWRSDWKWDRLAPYIAPLNDRLVLDVGCGNGYHAWRCAMAGARWVVGIDPTAVFLAQFLAISRLAALLDPGLVERIHLQPVGIEGVPSELRQFDTVFSMGVLYHRRSPLDHLAELKGALRPGGELVLETLVIEGGDQSVLVPQGRYAKMRNVWFIPSTDLLELLCRRVGFKQVRTVDVTTTTLEEQRRTEWMTFESLADFLDPADRGLTVEGYPAPRRALVIAEAG